MSKKTTNKNDKSVKNPAKKTRQEPKNAVDDIIPSKNSLVGLVIEEVTEAADKNTEKPMVEDVPEAKDKNNENEDVTFLLKLNQLCYVIKAIIS
ncbi:hypothetical protein TNCV_862961 [Trichonephila clavipes]|nr:hypothetical protein TNCV_862961 [Trichonephila clavipes]